MTKAAFAAPIAFAVLLVLVVSNWTPLRTLDLDVADGLNDATAPHTGLVTFWKTVSTVGTPFTFQVLTVVVAILLWLAAGQPRLAVFTAGTVVLAGLLSNLVKLLVGRDRPTVPDTVAHAAGSSFPSGHAMTSIVGVTVLLLVALPRVSSRWRTPLVTVGVLIVSLIAFSRLALGVHYVSDVVAGWLLGGSWVLLARALLLTAPEVRVPPRSAPGRPRRTPTG